MSETNLYLIGRDGNLNTAPSIVAVDGEVVKATPELVRKIGYVPLIETTPPEVPEGHALRTTFEYVYEDDPIRKGLKIRTGVKAVYEIVPPPQPEPEPTPVLADYDEEMENHLREER